MRSAGNTLREVDTAGDFGDITGRASEAAVSAESAKRVNQRCAPAEGRKNTEWRFSEELANERRRDVKLGFLIHDVSRMRRKAFDQFMRPLGVTRARWWVIAHLSRQDGMMLTQLADRMDVGKASLGDVIDRLESTGWVKREVDPMDKRAKHIYLARNSQQLLDKMAGYERAFNEQALRGLTNEDRDTLVRLLSVIKKSLPELDMGDMPLGED